MLDLAAWAIVDLTSSYLFDQASRRCAGVGCLASMRIQTLALALVLLEVAALHVSAQNWRLGRTT